MVEAPSSVLSELVSALRSAVGILHKQDIQTAADAIGQYVLSSDQSPIRLGDDCAAIPDGEGRCCNNIKWLKLS